MSTELAPITKDSEVCKVLACLPEKFIVDFANGIDVTRDHIRVQQQRTGFSDRLYDGFTGKGIRRQNEINACLVDGVEGALNWLTELTDSLTFSNYAIAQIQQRVNVIADCTTNIIHFSADTREQLNALSIRLDERCYQLSKEINRIDLEQRAGRQLDQVFNKWGAGRFNMFSLSGRCYAAIEELRWSDFGYYCHNHDNKTRQSFIEDLTNRAIKQLAIDSARSHSDRIEAHHWITIPSDRETLPDTTEALAYLGNWSHPENHPFVFSTTQRPKLLPLCMPKLFSAERVTTALVSEVFEGCWQ